jgi:hypothetical protein
MNEPVAWTCFLDAPAQEEPATVWRFTENGLVSLACRDVGANSNKALARAWLHSGFIAAGGAGTEQIFSAISG